MPSNPEGALLEYVCREINSNNCLGLSEEEVRGMAKELATSKTRKEVFDWANTLMMGEAFAAEILKWREDYGPPFEGETVKVSGPVVSSVELLTATLPALSSGVGSQDKTTQGGNAPGSKGSSSMKVAKKGKRAGVSLAQLQRDKSDGGAASVKPGRFECGCFGTIHNLRSNCANCGRIICEQEDDGCCYFCGLEPARCINYEIAVQEGKVSEAALQQDKENYEQAIARRDTLLDYARNRSKRTTVIDDQSATLFSPQSAWMSPLERQQQQKSLAEEERRRRIEKMHKHTGAYQVHVDFVGQNISLGARGTDAGDGKRPDAVADEEVSESGSSEGVCDPLEGDEDSVGLGGAAIEARAEPLPSLMQKIWYSPDGSRVESGRQNQKGVANTAEDMEGANKPMSGQKPVRRLEEVSRRVQQNYFEDDVLVFVEEALEAQRAELLFSPQDLLDTEPVDSDNVGTTVVEGDCRGQAAPGGSEGGGTEAALPLQSNAAFALRYAPTPQMRARDDGVCLSMHQPWASLLVAGIKTHEGRVWSTNYRGRLWIHAASAQPHDVEETEQHYTQFMSPGQVFPRHYPTRVLLGYVYVTECMDRETYEKAFPPEERQEGSPFSFICTEPKMLAFPLPMDGNHKLFTLEHKVHVAAKKQLKEIE